MCYVKSHTRNYRRRGTGRTLHGRKDRSGVCLAEQPALFRRHGAQDILPAWGEVSASLMDQSASVTLCALQIRTCGRQFVPGCRYSAYTTESGRALALLPYGRRRRFASRAMSAATAPSNTSNLVEIFAEFFSGCCRNRHHLENFYESTALSPGGGSDGLQHSNFTPRRTDGGRGNTK